MLTSHFFSTLFIFFLGLKLLAKFYLNWRNARHILRHRAAVPDKFSNVVSLDEHHKAADYSIAKLKLANISLLVDSALLFFLVKFHGLSYFDFVASNWVEDTKVRGLILFALVGIFSFFIELPLSLYQTFILEEKFGFNKTTLKIFLIDIVKSMLIGVIIGAPVLWSFFWLMEKMGTFWWIWGWIFLSLFQLTMMVLYPVLIAPIFNKFSPLPEGELKSTIVDLLKRVDFGFSGLFVMDASKRSSHGNAYFTGLGKNKRIVFFDTLLKDLNPKEAEAVLAHELGHFKHKHILKSMILSFVLSFIGMAVLGFLYRYEPFYSGHNVAPSAYMGLYLFSSLMTLYLFPFTPIFTAKSRKNEFEADHFAAKNSSADELIKALIKLYKNNAGTLTPDPLYSKIYYSHPPIFERVTHLENLDRIK